nr:reverse transcriptase domain-containing protein [Tanacetum cinerariifolium]
DVAELKDMVRALLLDKKNQSSALTSSPIPAPVKAVEPNYVTCSVAQPETQTLVSEPVVAPVSASMPNVKSSIPYPLRRDNERRRDQANEQIEKFYEIFKDMSFEISFTDALILMPKFASTLKALIGNKEKLRMDECLALADLGASINLMPLSVWEALLLPELTPTCMTLELADRSVSKPIGIAKDVSFKVGVFHFPADFVVVDFEPYPRVPLILRRCFLKTSRALIDAHKGELTLRIGNEAITYNLDQTMRYFTNYNQMMANKIHVIEMACKEYSQEVIGFSDVTTSGNPTPHDDPIVSTTTPMNEHCSAVILNKLPQKLGDPKKFLIPCEFPGMDECLSLAVLGASINLMPFSVWEALSLPELTSTCMTLELADRSVSKPIGIAKDVSFKVGVFHFSSDFVVIDFEPDPRVPLILGRCFLRPVEL